ncbi:MAG: cation transporter [Peptostreptococcaceae bacterium]|jgi:copper ion binding protein|nr:cation transporter [Peptostreptococcaceae bacterium]
MKIIKIQGMTCSHCTAAVESELKSLGELNFLEVSLENNSAKVEFKTDISDETIKNAIEDIGFDVIEIK